MEGCQVIQGRLNMLRQNLLLLFLTLTLAACGKSGGGSGGSSAEHLEGGIADIGEITGPDVPAQALSFKTSGVKLIEMTQAQEDKMVKALKILKLVVAT